MLDADSSPLPLIPAFPPQLGQLGSPTADPDINNINDIEAHRKKKAKTGDTLGKQ
jgi:hypothetical protein